MATQLTSVPLLQEAAESFGRGFRSRAVADANPTIPVFTERLPPYPYPLRTLNGSAIFRRAQDHVCIIRANVITGEEDRVKQLLIELTDHLRNFLKGSPVLEGDSASTVPNAKSEIDQKDGGQAAFVGFGTTFFWDRRTGAPRFEVSCSPKRLTFLRLAGDEQRGIDPIESQADLSVQMETGDYALLVEHSANLLRRFRCAREVIAVVDVQNGVTRGDGRLHLGFLDGIHNPSLSTTPSSIATVFTGPPDESPALESGSYQVFRRFTFQKQAWDELATTEQESVVGLKKETGQDLPQFPPHSHIGILESVGRPPIYRRGISYAELTVGHVEVGLLFGSFQSDPQLFVETFQGLFGGGPAPRDRLVFHPAIKQSLADLYFVPDFFTWQWGYVGQVFFDPSPFESLLEGNAHYERGEFEAAVAVFERIVSAHPTFFPAFANLSIIYQEMGLPDQANQAADQSLALCPTNYLANNNKAWTLYMQRQYESALAFAQRAIDHLFADDYRLFPYHTLGACLLYMGRPDQAMIALRQAAARPQTEPLVFFTLGNCLEELGRPTEAQAAYAMMGRIVSWRLSFGAVSPRELRAVFNLKYAHYRSQAAQEALARIESQIQGGAVTSYTA